MISGGGSESRSFSQPIDFTPQQFAALRGPFADIIQNQFTTGGERFAGDLTAPISGLELGGVNAVNNQAFGSGLGRLQDATLESTLRGDFLSPDSNPFLRDTIGLALEPIQRNAERQELVDRATFTRGGQRIQGNSGFEKQRLEHIQDTDRLATQTAGAIANQNLTAERANQLGAIGQANARIQSQMSAIASIALPRLVEDLGIQRGLEEFQRRMASVQNALQIGAGITNPTLGTASASSGDSFEFGISPVG